MNDVGEGIKHEQPVYFHELLDILGWSKSKYYSFNAETGMRWCDELKLAGVVFRQYEKVKGCWPRKRLKALPSRINNWRALKAAKGERI